MCVHPLLKVTDVLHLGGAIHKCPTVHLRDGNKGVSSSGEKGNCRRSTRKIFLEDVASRYEMWLHVGLPIQLIKNKQINENTFTLNAFLGI